ncbi:MAG: hypothetical protein AAGA75_24100 [Cyanobacteria bacterium P01_E01_bin.6]
MSWKIFHNTCFLSPHGAIALSHPIAYKTQQLLFSNHAGGRDTLQRRGTGASPHDLSTLRTVDAMPFSIAAAPTRLTSQKPITCDSPKAHSSCTSMGTKGLNGLSCFIP